MLYGILRLTIVIYSHLQLTIVIYSHISEMDSWLNFKLSRPKVSQNWTKMAKNTHALTILSPDVKKFQQLLSVPIAQLVKACQRCYKSEGLEFKPQSSQIFFQVV